MRRMDSTDTKEHRIGSREIVEISLTNSQLLLRFIADHVRVPRWIPNQINRGVTDSVQSEDALPRISSDHRAHAAAGRRQRHLDCYFVVIDLHVINYNQVHDFYRDL